MKYLVTGGAGFIGSNFIHFLFEKYSDCQVTNLDKLTYAGNTENLRKFEHNPNYTFVQGDIADPSLVNKLIADTDFIVNFAAETHVDRSIIGPAQFIQTNVVGMQVLLDAAVKQIEHSADVFMEGHEYGVLRDSIASYYVAAVAQTAFRRKRA